MTQTPPLNQNPEQLLRDCTYLQLRQVGWTVQGKLDVVTRKTCAAPLAKRNALLPAEIGATLYSTRNKPLFANGLLNDQPIIFEALENGRSDKRKIKLWRFEKYAWMRAQELTSRGQGRQVEARRA